jgi:Pyruvate/2-oxoacid:ferredoxin oxidoreductase gamma subunit
LDPETAGIRRNKRNLALLMAATALRQLRLYPIEALEAAIRRGQRNSIIEESLEVLAKSAAVAIQRVA